MPKTVERNLTDNVLRSAQGKEGRYDLYDAQVRGLGVRIGTSGTKSWFVMTRVAGRMTRRTIGHYPRIGLKEARIRGAEELAKMARGEMEAPAKRQCFHDVYREWLQRDQGGNKTVSQVKKAMELHVLPKLGQRRLDDIKKADVLKLIDGIRDSGAEVQANRVLAFLRRFFNWCLERDYLDGNPTLGIAKPTKEVARDRVLSPDEIARVLQAAEAIRYPFGPFVKLLILTGQRRDEVAGMRWREINDADCVWVLPAERSKNGKAHTVHLSDAAIAVLRSVPRIDGCELVFPATRVRRKTDEGEPAPVLPISGFSTTKRQLDELSGVTGWTLHDLRRSFATHCTEKLGVSPVVVDKVLNHQSGAVRGVAAVYQRGQYLEERRNALEAWGRWIEVKS
ncbi:tyrosine-type recombinase/integrase [Roseicyclus marinus]|uniref:Integrase n=1 Tax=Roseicyclus marinus TaxID=2161673 RepID=A0AA48KJ83_9RHOB|nr:integrase [Roseicyclus marinus]